MENPARRLSTSGIILFLLLFDKIVEWCGRLAGLLVDGPEAMKRLNAMGIDNPIEFLKWTVGLVVIGLVWVPWEKWFRKRRRGSGVFRTLLASDSPIPQRLFELAALQDLVDGFYEAFTEAVPKVNEEFVKGKLEVFFPNKIGQILGPDASDEYLKVLKDAKRKTQDIVVLTSTAILYLRTMIDRELVPEIEKYESPQATLASQSDHDTPDSRT